MKFWTFQKKELVEGLANGVALVPDFSIGEIAGLCREAYKYVLGQYNITNNISASGLVFGHVGNSKHITVDSMDELYSMLEEVGKPFGTSFGNETHLLLELEIPDSVHVMLIDFYKFTDLLFFMEYGGDEDCEISKRYLFEPNRPNGEWELLQGHIPCILPDWVKNVYTPK